MPKSAFLHKKSLLDTFKDDYRVTNPIKAARAERTWDNPIVRHKREREINKWAHSFAGKKHFRKLTRFNATREANESCRVLYPLEDVVKVVTDALRTIRTRIYQVDGYYQFIQDKLQYGMVVAKDIAHRDFPYRWEVQANLVTRLKKGNEIVMEYHPDTPEQLSEYLQEEGAIEPNEAKMKISVRESKKNEKDEPTYVWFGLEQDEDGDFTDSIAVFVDDVHNGMVTTYAHLGQHSDASLDYVRGLYADPNPKGDLYKELIGQGYDNLVVVNTNVAEDMLGVGMFPDGDQRADEDPDKYDKYESNGERTRMTAWTYLGELEKLEGADSRKDAQSKLLKALGFTQGTEGRWYDGEGDLIDIINELDNAEWDFAVKTCGPLQESRKAREDFYKGKDRGFLVLVQKLIADNWYAGARKEYPGLTLDCYEMDGAGDDMKICFEAYGEEIDDPMSEGLMEIAEESAKKGCTDANRSTDPLIADYGLEANFISWDEPDVFRDQWNYVINLSSKPKGKKGESKKQANEMVGNKKWVIRIKRLGKNYYVCSSSFRVNKAFRYPSLGGPFVCSDWDITERDIAKYDNYNDAKKAWDSMAQVLRGGLPFYKEGEDYEIVQVNFSMMGESKEPADEKLGYEKGHKNSKGEPAPWVIRSHEDNRVLASFANKDDAYAHLQRMKQYSESRSVDDYDILRDGLKDLGFELDSDTRNGKVYAYRSRFKATKDGVVYRFIINEDGEDTASIEVFVGDDEKPTRYKTVDDVLTAFKGTFESFHKVQVKDTLFDILKKHGVNDKAKVSYDGDAIVCEYDGTTIRIDNDLALTAKMQDKTIDRKYGTLADLSADLDKYFTKYVKEALEKNGVIVVPEWLWVAYKTGDSKFLSIEEMQILDGFKAMAAGKVFDAEAEPSFRAFNDFDDYAGNCYEVQVYTIKEK